MVRSGEACSEIECALDWSQGGDPGHDGGAGFPQCDSRSQVTGPSRVPCHLVCARPAPP